MTSDGDNSDKSSEGSRSSGDGKTDMSSIAVEPLIDHRRRWSEYLPAIGAVLAVLYFGGAAVVGVFRGPQPEALVFGDPLVSCSEPTDGETPVVGQRLDNSDTRYFRVTDSLTSSAGSSDVYETAMSVRAHTATPLDVEYKVVRAGTLLALQSPINATDAQRDLVGGVGAELTSRYRLDLDSYERAAVHNREQIRQEIALAFLDASFWRNRKAMVRSARVTLRADIYDERISSYTERVLNVYHLLDGTRIEPDLDLQTHGVIDVSVLDGYRHDLARADVRADRTISTERDPETGCVMLVSTAIMNFERADAALWGSARMRFVSMHMRIGDDADIDIGDERYLQTQVREDTSMSVDPATGLVQSVKITTRIFNPAIAGFDATETIEIVSVEPPPPPVPYWVTLEDSN